MQKLRKNNMCLIYILPENKKQEFIDKIDSRKGMTVYKVAEIVRGRLLPPYRGCLAYKGTMEETSKQRIQCEDGSYYRRGFHFFTSKEAAQRMCTFANGTGTLEYKVISANIRKSWVNDVGVEKTFAQPMLSCHLN